MEHPPFVDAQEMALAHPDTFWVESLEKLRTLRVGDYVKVCTGDERFWCIIQSIDGDDTLTCVVDNDLLNTSAHGYSLGDLATVRLNEVYDYMEQEV